MALQAGTLIGTQLPLGLLVPGKYGILTSSSRSGSVLPRLLSTTRRFEYGLSAYSIR